MEKVKFNIRTATTSDIPILNQLYQKTILQINRKDYSLQEAQSSTSSKE